MEHINSVIGMMHIAPEMLKVIKLNRETFDIFLPIFEGLDRAAGTNYKPGIVKMIDVMDQVIAKAEGVKHE